MTPKMRYDTGSDFGNLKVLPDPPAYVPRPMWQPFPGFSFLFDNPGNSLKSMGQYQKIHVDETCISEIDLYAKLSQAVSHIDANALAQRFNFFALPPSTYHVTVWDGINRGIEDRLAPEVRDQFRNHFANGIDGVLASWPPFGDHSNYSNWFDSVGTIRLRYRGLRARGSTVLVVELEADPADSASCKEFEALCRLREDLDGYFAENYKKIENNPLRPHVAIGYFADFNLGNSALFRHMDAWMAEFDRIASGSVIEFKRIGLYAFSDMVTYFKPA
jgi:hypothetical protein